jgi:hypothetical protein
MKSNYREKYGPVVILTIQVLKELKKRGFHYVHVNAFTSDKRLDYMEPRYFVLVPIKELPQEREKKGIYELVDSPTLINWANAPDEGIKVFVLRQNP